MPRSPSRDRSDRFTGHRGYFRRPGAMGRWKYRLAGVGLLGALLWAGIDAVGTKRAVYAHTHGTLANPHAAWDSDCAACHKPFAGTPLSPFAAGDRWRDFTCEKCHAGPAHHAPSQTPDATFHQDCGNCHHDHGGRTNSLTRLADSHCVRCHADLSAHPAAKYADPRIHSPITGFVKDHPEFRPLSTPPETRTLKFSHALHMTAGLSYTPDGKEALTPERVKSLYGEETAKRYTTFEAGKLQLQCASCHQLDAGAGDDFAQLKKALDAAGQPARSVLPARAAGAHFLPVNFEAHCQACHPVRAPDRASGEIVLQGFTLPHRLPPDKLNDFLTAGYLRELVKENQALLNKPLEPGKPINPEPARAVRDEIARLVGGAARQVHEATCIKCHDTKPEGGIVPLPDRTVWLPSARFDHTAHRGVTCLSCHPGTAGADVSRAGLVEKEPVQILGIDSCKACHSPGTTTGGGVRHGCTDCHSYHNADHPLQGRGATARTPKVSDGK